MTRIVDLSVHLANDIPADPPTSAPRIEYLDHEQGIPGLLANFPGLTADQLPEGEAWAGERVQLTALLQKS